VLAVTLPSWRPDSTAEIDVIEEVARHYGYSRIGRRVPKTPEGGGLSPVQQRRRLVREVLLGLGINEAMPDVFLTAADLAKAGLPADAVTLANPLVAEQFVMRPSLLPGLLKSLAYNESHRNHGVALFEIGQRYLPREDVLPLEIEQLSVVLAGQEAPAAVQVWEELKAALRWKWVRLSGPPGAPIPGLHPARQGVVAIDERDPLGVLGEVDPGVLEAFGVDERVAVLDLDLSRLLAIEPETPQWRPISRYPSSDIDLAFLVPDGVAAADVGDALRHAAGALLIDLTLFDVYRGQGVPDGQRSLAYHLRLQAADRTLTDADVAEVRERCIRAAAALGATLR
jgi:phenylalanyl-tRNA synthetase beta chain